METFTGLGFMLGPPLGGVLYSVSYKSVLFNRLFHLLLILVNCSFKSFHIRMYYFSGRSRAR